MKKWLSMLLAAILILNIVLPTNVFAETDAKSLNEVTLHVSASGNDSTGDGTSSNPYATISKAESVLEANGAADLGRIVISGSLNFTAATHTKMITITGNGNSSAVLNIAPANAEINIAGPTTFENITLTGSNNVNQGQLQTQQNELVIGEGVTFSGKFNSYFRIGANNAASGNEQGTGNVPAFVFDGVTHSSSTNFVYLRIGTGYGHWMNGANITINGGKISEINFHRATQFSQDVNLIINGGDIGQIYKQSNAAFTGEYRFHKALQVIFNNDSINDVNTFNKASLDEIPDNGGKWYIYGDNTGGSLTTTDKSGIFLVNGTDVTAKATNIETNEVYYADCGSYLRIPAGEYNVTYLPKEDDVIRGLAIRYVSATGDDGNNGLTKESAFKTLSKAEASLEEVFEAKEAGEGLIFVSGVLNFTAATHTKMITITSDGNSSTTLNIAPTSSEINIAGPTRFENITLTGSNNVNQGQLQTQQNELVIGKGVTFSGKINSCFRIGANNAVSGNEQGTGNIPTFVFDGITHSVSGQTCNIRIGTGYGHWMNGANVTINGGKVADINFHRATQFSENVNIVINGGTIGTIQKQTNAAFTGTYKFHKALQIVFNNGSFENVTTFNKTSIEDFTAIGGKWYIYGDNTGGSLSVTETAGTFKVNGDKYAIATLKSDETKVYYGKPGGYLIVPDGEYDVTYQSEKPYPDEPHMIYLDSVTTQSGKVFGTLAQNLEKNTQYTISFKCKVIEGNFDNASTDDVFLRVRKEKMRSGTTLCEGHVATGEEKGFDTYKLDIDGYTRRYTFTTDDTNTNYGINFEFNRAMKMYIADFVIYKTSDATKTNVLAVSPVSEVLTTEVDENRTPGIGGWDSDYPKNVSFNLSTTKMTYAADGNTFYTAELMPYDSENVFIPVEAPEKQMLYVKNEGTQYDCLVQDVNIKPGVQYTVSYDYRLENGGMNTNGAYLALQGGSGSMNVNKTYRNSFVANDNVTKFDVVQDNGMRAEYTFTLSEDEVDDSGNYKIGFYFYANDLGKNAEFYVANFTVYATNDADKTNLLVNEGYSKNMYGWYSNWRKAADGAEEFGPSEHNLQYTAKYVDYIDTYFKSMLHVKHYSSGTDDLLQNVTLEKGKTYTVSFKYKYITGYEDYNVYFAVGNKQPNAGSIKFYHQSHINQFDKVIYDTEWSEVQYIFTLNNETLNEGENDCSVGFRFEGTDRNGCTTEMYIADMVLYETNSEEKENLLSVTDYADGMYGWCNIWRSAAKGDRDMSIGGYTATYVPYVEKYFIHIGYGDANEDTQTDVRDLVRQQKMLAEQEYSPYADSNKDGQLSKEDLVSTRKHIVGTEEIQNLITPFELKKGGAEEEASQLKEQIVENQDSIEPNTGLGAILNQNYYVDSENGNDSNSGTSQDAPFKTISKVNQLALDEGAKVFFKRGSVFRLSEPLKVRSGVSYGTYGDGDKPQFLGSLKDYGDVEWTETATEGVWKLAESVTGEAGVVTFDGDTAVGNRVLTVDKMRKNGDYYHDYKGDGSFYLYLKGANPKDYFNSIEIGSTGYLIRGMWKDLDNDIDYRKTDVTIENIAIMYCSNTAIDFSHSENISISGCEFSWIGGAYNESAGSGYGNAITLWRDNINITISNCFFYQIYDAAVTFQGDKPNSASDSKKTEYENITCTNLLMEYTSMNFEYWGSNSTLWNDDETLKPQTVMKNISLKDSMIRFGGYGFGGINRPVKKNQGCLLGWNYEYYDSDIIENFEITNNTFDTSDCYIFYSPTSLNSRMTISGNSYYQGKSLYRANWGSDLVAENQTTLEDVIKTFDSNPKYVEWTE